MSVVMFAMVKCYRNGLSEAPSDYALNVGQIVGFHQRTLYVLSPKCNGDQLVSYVELETTSRNNLAIEGTMDDLFAAIKQAEALVQSSAYPYGPPIEPLRRNH